VRSRLTHLLAAALLGAAAGTVALIGPAAAAACPKGSGVTVVVGSRVSCDADGGGPAAKNFTGTGHSLTYVQRQPGFVCKVDGAPDISCVNTPPADHYWGLFWSTGTSGSWTYASSGVGSLSVPSGGWVAFVLQTSSSRTYPGVKPIAAAPAPKPSPARTTARPTRTPSPSPSTAAEKKKAAVKKKLAREAETSQKAQEKAGESQASKAAERTTEDRTRDASQDVDGNRAPIWAAGAIAIVLLGGMGGMVWRRRAAGGHRS
jgi:hypothetical protein